MRTIRDLLPALLAVSGVFAQTGTGVVRGIVVDPANAAMPGASVELTNLGTNIATRIATSPASACRRA
jgi:hypothetical protein